MDAGIPPAKKAKVSKGVSLFNYLLSFYLFIVYTQCDMFATAEDVTI